MSSFKKVFVSLIFFSLLNFFVLSPFPLPFFTSGAIDTSESEVPVDSSTFASGLRAALERVSEDSQGFSGRTLRKLPFIAFALYIRSSVKPNLVQFIDALSNAVQRQKDERGHIPT